MAQPDPAGQGPGYAVPLLFVAVAVAAAVVLTYAGGSYGLDRSAIGFDGLVAWLSKSGVEARTFSGGDQLTHSRVGLRVYPVFDVDLGGLLQPHIFDDRKVEPGVVKTKLARLPTLIVLPKWQGEVIKRGVVHPNFLIPDVEVGRLAAAVSPETGALLSRGNGFMSIATDSGELRLYAGQLVEPGHCTPLIGGANGMLLGRCGRGDTAYWLLSDPDLLDNHGLTQGANARLAAAVLPRLADGGPIVVDLTTTSLWDEPPKEQRRRSWSELLRFFAPPFTAAWAALLLLMALVLWRAWVRMGPIDRAADDGLQAARAVSIDARARLLRLSGHDARLVRLYAGGRLQALAETLFGRRASAGDAFHDVGQLLSRRAPGLAAPFNQAFRGDVEGPANEGELLRRVDDLQRISERIQNEFGRTAKSRGPRPR